MSWSQKLIQLKPKKRGFHLITNELLSSIQSDISKYTIGLCHFFLQHTSASLTINENADSDVRIDMETIVNRIVPESEDYKHDAEGSDDMPGHTKSSLLGCEVTVPITNGKLNLGKWQGVYLGEHRNHGGTRQILVTIQGQLNPGAKTDESKNESE